MHTIEDEPLLLAVLNSTPVVGGTRTDQFDGEQGTAFALANHGTGSDAEVDLLRAVRSAVQQFARGGDGRARLDEALAGVTLVPTATDSGLQWTLDGPAEALLAARVAMAWSQVEEHLPGRLRACANDECNLFLIDRSRPGSARWCSMATCGNRMKARAHAGRKRESA